jgi:hypothetical protein
VHVMASKLFIIASPSTEPQRSTAVTPLVLRARLAPRLIPKRNYLTGSLG